jgi:hypothetical protein
LENPGKTYNAGNKCANQVTAKSKCDEFWLLP